MTKEKNLYFRFYGLISFIVCGIILLSLPRADSFAQEDNQLVGLTKQIIESKTNDGLYAPFDELKTIYFKDNKYPDFVEFLKSLTLKKKEIEPFVDYYIALTRYSQLKYLEEKQNWDEYFSQGNTYRDEITAAAQKSIDATGPKDALWVYARLLLWQFHKDQQDVLAEQALADLMSSVSEYSKEASDPLPIKNAADKLLSYGEKSKSRELYKIYVSKIVSSDIKDDQLKNTAEDFYKQGNLELSEAIYDVYLERIIKSLPKEESTAVLIDIAKLFAYPATSALGGSASGGKNEGPNDMLYAEKIFNKIEELAGKEYFNQDLIYLRAFNLEKAKEYQKAKDIYVDFVQRFLADSRVEQATYKIGVICAYVLRDIKCGRDNFVKLAEKETTTPYVISSLYQLGLLSQWENDLEKAKGYYNKLLEKAKEDFSETLAMAKERIKEIEEARPMEYNIKTFLDVSLKGTELTGDMQKLSLNASSYILNKGKEVIITSGAYVPESGCMQVELQYLWSGDLEKTKPPLEQLPLSPSFATSYKDLGTKLINLVVIAPGGILDRNIDMLDVY